MHPYLRAHASSHRAGTPYVPWIDVLDFHLQHGVVISERHVFLMARPVLMEWPDFLHVSFHLPDPTIGETADAWHVWSASGDLTALLSIARAHGARAATFQRRSRRVHRYQIDGDTARLLTPTTLQTTP